MRTIAFTLSLVFIFFIPWEGVIELPGLGTASKLIGFAVAVCWLATVVITDRVRKPGPFHIMVCLFVLWNAVSVFWSADPETTVVHVVRWVQLLGMVFILWDLYTTRAALLAGLQAFILGEYVGIGIAVANYFSGNVFYSHYQRFSPSDQSNPDGFGFIVVLGIPVAFYLAASANTTRMSGLLKLVKYAYIPAAFILLPHVQSLRSFQRLGTTYAELSEGTLNNRTNNWREGLATFSEHPLIGVGGDMYSSENSLGKIAHNSFISVLVELGLIGFALFGSILMFAVISAWGQPKWDARFWLTTLLVWAIGASALTYEYKKATWLFLSFVIASAALPRTRDEMAPLVRRDKSFAQFVR